MNAIIPPLISRRSHATRRVEMISRQLCSWLAAAALAAGLAAPPPALAQGGTSTASVSGRVGDDTGGVMPGVLITIINAGTNQARSNVTDDKGVYRFAGLNPGRYTVTAELEGFAKFVQNDVLLQVGGAVDLNITMKLSSLSESLTVSGQAAIIEAAKTDLSTVISRDQIETLPTISRNFLDYALLTPGVVKDERTTG